MAFFDEGRGMKAQQALRRSSLALHQDSRAATIDLGGSMRLVGIRKRSMEAMCMDLLFFGAYAIIPAVVMREWLSW
jgi:hypothetical protein